MLKLSKEQIEKLKNKANVKTTIAVIVFSQVVTATPILGDIVSKPLGYTTEKLREVIEKVTNEYIRSCFAILKSEPNLFKIQYFHIVGSSQGAFYWNPNICITNWTRQPLYGVDFGWGKEIYMVPRVIGYDGNAFILPIRDEYGSFLIPL
ncbi:hypothetical protein ACSBR2_035570 [Camellia fascicularis]